MSHVLGKGTLWSCEHRGSRLVKLTLFGFVLGWCTIPPVVRAGEPNLPDAAAILDKYVEVTGGEAAYAKVHNRVTKQTVTHVGMGFDDSVMIYQGEPNKRYVTIESDAFGTIENGTDGEVVWYLSDQTGPLIEGGTARVAELLAATFNAPVRWRELYRKAELVGEEAVEGRPCYKIVMTPEVGEPETRYYDKESNLLVKVEQTRLSSNFPPLPLEVMLGDYKPVDGLLIAHKRKQVMHQCGSERAMLFVTNSIEHNVVMPPYRFDPPEEIRAAGGVTASRENTSGSGGCPGSGAACGGSSTSSASSCGGANNATQAGTVQPSQGAGGCGGGSPAAAAKATDKPQGASGCCGSGS